MVVTWRQGALRDECLTGGLSLVGGILAGLCEAGGFAVEAPELDAAVAGDDLACELDGHAQVGRDVGGQFVVAVPVRHAVSLSRYWMVRSSQGCDVVGVWARGRL